VWSVILRCRTDDVTLRHVPADRGVQQVGNLFDPAVVAVRGKADERYQSCRGGEASGMALKPKLSQYRLKVSDTSSQVPASAE